jgi:hypothetical protein
VLLGRFRKFGRDVTVSFLARLGADAPPVRIFFQEWEKVLISGKPSLVRPFRAGSDLLRRFDYFPFRRRNHANKVALYDYLRIRETSLIERANGNEL